VVLLRILVSVSIAIIGAVVPGFLSIDWSIRGATIRAGGAMALFVLTYLLTPEVSHAPSKAETRRLEEAYVFLAGYNFARLTKDPARHPMGDSDVLTKSLSALHVDVNATHASSEEIESKLAASKGTHRKTQFANARAIAERCMAFGNDKLPMAIHMELEDLVRPFDLPDATKRVPVANAVVWLTDLRDYYEKAIRDSSL
jgi:hypothetical protein